jgi:hypothetical protein
MRPATKARLLSSRRSGRSIRSRKSANCCRELVQKPTYPSAVGSIEGVSTDCGSPPI